MSVAYSEIDFTTIVIGLLAFGFAYLSVIGNATSWVVGSYVVLGLVLILIGVRAGFKAQSTIRRSEY